MNEKELNDIIGNQSNDTFLNTEKDSIIPETIQPIQEGFVCPDCNKSFKTQLALIGHSRTHNKGIKEKSSLKKADNQIPTSTSYLEEMLEGYSIPNRKGILLALKDNPESIDELREALKSVRVDKNTADYIVKKYANSIGKNISSESAPVEISVSPLKQTVGMLNDSLQVQLLQNMLQPKQSIDINNPKMDAIQLQMAQMQEANKRLEALLTQQKTDNEINLLKKQLEDVKRESNGQIGSVMDNLKEYITSMTNFQEKAMLQNDNKFEKLLLEMRHQKETDELKNQLQQATNSKPLQERAFDKTSEIADKALMGIGNVYNKALSSQDTLEKANAAMLMKQQGFSTDIINNILNPNQKPSVPSAKDEYENLQRMTSEMQAELEAKQTQKLQPEPQAEAVPTVTFNAGD